MQQTISYIISSGTRLLCVSRENEVMMRENEVMMRENEVKQPHGPIREPNENEMRHGVPQWFRIQEVATKSDSHVDKYYFSTDGHKFSSIKELKKWRENLEFEDYETDALSF